MSRILGGLLQGLGEGMVEQGRAQREAAMEQIRYERQLARDDMQHGRALERDELGHERNLERDDRQHQQNLGLLNQRQSHDMRMQGIRHSNSLAEIQARAEAAGRSTSIVNNQLIDNQTGEVLADYRDDDTGDDEASGAPEMSAEEMRVFDQIKQRYTDPNTDRVDWEGFQEHLRNMPAERGGARFNEYADYLTGGVGMAMTASAARQQAEREARQRAPGWLSGSEEEAWGEHGSEEAWIENRIRELRGGRQEEPSRAGLDQLRERGRQTRSQNQPAEGQADETPSQSDELPRVTTRAEYDALPSGTRYIAPDGSRRTKQ